MTLQRSHLVATLAGAVLAGAAVWSWRPAPVPAPPVVQTDTLWLEARRPQLAHPSLGQRLTTTRVRGQTTIADAPSAPGRLAVAAYCAPVIPDPQLGKPAGSSISVEKEDPAPALLPDFRGRRAGPRLELFSTLGDGRRWQWTGTARGRVSWASSGDTVLVTGDRLWVRLLRGAPKCLVRMGAHGLVGGLLDKANRLEGAAIAAGVRALDCLM